MICVFDNHEMRKFKFNEECNIAQIESADVVWDIEIPCNARTAWNGEKIIMVNQTGFTEKTAFNMGGIEENAKDRLS